MNQTGAFGMDMESAMPIHYPMAVCDKTVSSELSGEYLLPDYMTGIRRILTVDGTALPPSRYVGPSSIELNGTVDHRILYLGEDGGLHTIPMTTEYTLSVPYDNEHLDMNEGVTVLVSSACETPVVRVSGPGRLSLRGRLHTHLRAFGCGIPEEHYSGEMDPSRICRRREETEAVRMICVTAEPTVLNEELSGFSEDARIVSAEASPWLSETRIENGTLRLNGDLPVRLLICDRGGRVESVEKRVPFAISAECEGADAEWHTDARISVTELELTAEEGRIVCTATLVAEATLMKNLPMVYTEDLYSTARVCDTEYEDYSLPVVLRAENRSISQSERIAATDLGIPEGARILDARGDVTVEECSGQGDRLVVMGQSRYRLIWERDGEYGTAELTLPMRYETEGVGDTPKQADALCRVALCRARMDGETACLDAELTVSVSFLGEKTVRAVSGASFGELTESGKNRFTVYYPTAGEDRWQVAKRYAVSPDRLTEGNGFFLI